MTRPEIVAAARGWIGTPYAHQGSLRGVGCDCLGLLRGIWRELIGPEPEAPPPYSRDWAEAAGLETLLETAQRHLLPATGPIRPGDVLLFRWRPNLPAKHCAIAASSCLPPCGEGGLSGGGAAAEGRMGGLKEEQGRSIRLAPHPQPLPARGRGVCRATPTAVDTASADTMIHAHEGACVAEVALAPFWMRHLAGHFAFPKLEREP